jgi:hypothetical protein
MGSPALRQDLSKAKLADAQQMKKRSWGQNSYLDRKNSG